MFSSIPGNRTDAIENEFDSFVLNELKFSIPNRGAAFNFEVCARIPAERHLYDNDKIYTIDAAGSVDGFIQVFQASTNNIHNIRASLSGQVEPDVVIDDFESYSTDAELQAVYVSSDPVNTIVTLDTSAPFAGLQCMAVSMSRNKGIGDMLTMTFPSAQNWSAKEAIQFMFKSPLTGASNQWRINISDGTNVAYIDFNALVANTWEERNLAFSAFTNISLVDLTSITSASMEIMSLASTAMCYFDNWSLVGGASNSMVEVRLYDFGTTQAPTVLGSLLPQDNDAWSVPLELPTSKQVILAGVNFGSHELEAFLVPGNFYGIYITKPDVGTVSFYGSAEQQYMPGKCYSDSAGTLTEVPGTLGFMMMSATEARLSALELVTDADPGHSQAFLFVTDVTTGETIFFSEMTLDLEGQKLVMKDILPEYLWTSQTIRLSVYYMDAVDSQATYILVRPKYYYNVTPTNG